MRTTTLGQTDIEIGVMGLGCMGMSEFYGATNEAESIKVLHRAIELGVNFFDTSDIYGPLTNEMLLKKGLVDSGKRDQVVIATKFGIVRSKTEYFGVCGHPTYVRKAAHDSLTRLGIDTIDLYYQHRMDESIPIEDTVGALKGLIDQGKIRAYGLSEASPEIIRRAHAVHPVTALQTEYSLWTRHVEEEILDVCDELGITFVGYSPLGRGMLTGRFKSINDLPADDWRRNNPRFTEEAFAKNLELVSEVEKVAEKHNVTPSQVALAWIHAQDEDLTTIPGTKRLHYLEQNVASLEIELDDEDFSTLDHIATETVGNRY